MGFILSGTAESLLILLVVIVLGYCVARIQVKGLSLGVSSIFLVGLVFGALGFEAIPALEMFGLTLFIASLGLSSGPTFVQRLKLNGKYYVIICLCVAFTGAMLTLGIIKICHVSAPLTVGIMTGSYTTSPGFAAAREAAADIPGAVVQVAVGNGIAYPLGVISKVLFIQQIPRWLHADMARERALIAVSRKEEKASQVRGRLDKLGLSSIALAILTGMLLGAITIKLPGGGEFSLGSTGGPLIMGLLIGHIGHIGRLELKPDSRIYPAAKEIGLILFFSNAGIDGGSGIIEIIQQYGFMLIVYALILVAVPLVVGFFMFYKVLKLPLLNGLGCLTASMTSTPALAALIQLSDTDDVTSAYATTYPIAMIIMVLLCQILIKL